MGFFGMVIKTGKKELVEIQPGWCLQLCTAVLEPPKAAKPQETSATLWLQVEGEIGDTSFLIGSLQGGGPSAQIALRHCLTSVDGDVIVEAKGSGSIHLTGFFEKEYGDESTEGDGDSEDEEEDDDGMMPGLDVRRAKSKGSMYEMDDGVDYEEDSDDDDEEDNGDENGSKTMDGRRGMRFAAVAAAKSFGPKESKEEEEESEEDDDYLPGDNEEDLDSMDYDDEDKNEEDEDEEEENGDENGSKTMNGRRGMRFAAVAAAKSFGTKEREEEEESEDDDDYLPIENEDLDSTDDDEEDNNEEEDDSEDDNEEGKYEKSSSGGKKKKSVGSKRGAGDDVEKLGAPETKKSRTEEKKGAAEASELTKQEKKRLRKKENKRKATEAKRELEKAFSAGGEDEDEDEPPVGVPLKSPPSRALKGGLKVKDTVLGGGKVAVRGKIVKICYEGCFPDGRVFDKKLNRKKPFEFRLGMRQVVVGMDRGLEGMRVGGSREISIPSSLGYGERGSGLIPANQDLVFRVELIDVLGK